ncbi:LIM/homeobox protein Lhx9-like [Uloborus diversus]|uniref:LIM/homeobox protein Lhx9-like n=1 Tax=Uloborus diversus TaxID=327109 RepID=UPI0024094308|nr:LIM/homeobox protein Lhx9-like [Uloborus diversus]
MVSGITMPAISVPLPGEMDAPPPPPSLCAGCGSQISDRYYLQAVDRQWHAQCLTCHRCQMRLDTELTCFWRDGHIYCKEDYYRLFAVRRCSRCQRGIFARELVMRAREHVFHLHCFTCAWCESPLAQGDHFGLRDGLVYCRAHYEAVSGREQPHPYVDEPGLPHSEDPLSGGYPGVFAGGGCGAGGTGRKGRPRKKKSGDAVAMDALSRHGAGLSPIDPSTCNLHLSHLDGGTNSASQSSPPLSGSGQRTKRMRTSFKHHQLRTMKSYFAINQNPDAKDLKQLAQKTGLSKRVLQVWFQNARAKWRRNNMKQQDGMPGMLSNDQPSTPQLHSVGGGLCSPGASSYSEPSPVHSCGGVPSDGSISTQVGPSMDFDSSNPMTPLVSHPGLTPVHNGEGVMHITSFHELF